MKMSDFIKKLEIKNFKSIKHLQMDCKRVNVFIGKPNVGKSNILEGLSLLGGGYSFNKSKFLSEFVRYKHSISELFYDKKYINPIEITTDKLCGFLRYHNNSIESFDFMIGGDWINQFLTRNDLDTIHEIEQEFKRQTTMSTNEEKYAKPIYASFDNHGNRHERHGNTFFSLFKKYDFKPLDSYNSPFSMYLNPPNGNNLFTIIYQDDKLQDEINEILASYGLFFAYRDEVKEFEIMKLIKRNTTLFPYSSMADTFQRLIFHLAAIEGNKNSVLIFEEPEAHSYPPYVWQLANRIAYDKDNQYFISTHSPYIIETLLQELKNDEVNVCVTSFEEYETKINVLQPDALQDLYDLGADTVFMNMDKFEKATL
jgi:AAA15 family ATPase/GTPase